MATKINEYYYGNTTLNNFIQYLKKQFIGFFDISIDEFDTLDKPTVIKAGSIVEFEENIYSFEIDTAITGTPDSGTAYIKIYLDGSNELQAEFTNDTPEWDNDRRGWYDEETNEAYRYIFSMIVDGSNYRNKHKMDKEVLDHGKI